MKTIIVLFGITGDLSRRKLLPALESIYLNVPHPCEIIGISRRHVPVSDIISENSNLRDVTSIVTMDLTNEHDYHQLWHDRIAGQDAQVLVYLAVPPLGVERIMTNLAAAGFAAPNVKLLLEKPFGVDIRSSEELFHHVESLFERSQMYLVDHYLGKRGARAIVDFRRSCPTLAKVWNRESVERIDIVAAESLDIEGRAAFYEQAGALRDVLQGHLLQLLALTIAPLEDSGESLASARLRAIKSLLPAEPEKSLHGQYEGYRDEAQSPNSQVETYAELTFFSDDPTWTDVPIVLTTGKSLADKRTLVAVQLKQAGRHSAGRIEFGIDPETGITARFDESGEIADTLIASANQYTIDDAAWNGYEAILLDVIAGDQTFFVTRDEVVASWQAVDDVLNNWQRGNPLLVEYPKGSTIDTIRSLAKHLD